MKYLIETQVMISPASMREISEAVGVALTSVSTHLIVLEELGQIKRPDTRSRTRHIEIVQTQME